MVLRVENAGVGVVLEIFKPVLGIFEVVLGIFEVVLGTFEVVLAYDKSDISLSGTE